MLKASTTRSVSGVGQGSWRVNNPLLFEPPAVGNPVVGSTGPGAVPNILGLGEPGLPKIGELGPDHSNFPPLATRIASSSSQILPVRSLRSEIVRFARPGAMTIFASGYLSRTAS